ncbi:3-dehydroquinate synthase [Candidatus Micrarchaeota archaeon]|nr:3-dehydroquinate synthase [Candidatus Micrarchaeota archaeon]
MKSLKIAGKTGECEIAIGQSIEDIKINAEKLVVITDRNVKKFHGERFPEAEIIEIGLGERIKTLDTVSTLYEKFLDMELDRSSLVMGIGGGIVCDVAGFAATTYMRGVNFGFVPTTILAQVDASIGGKNGVNFKGYKNMVGTVQQPRFVLCDVALLKTLPEKEVRNGLAEVVKQAAIGDAALFSFLEENVEQTLLLEAEIMEKIVHDSIVIKTKIVEKDETERHERMKLNFGHTIAHAIEKTAGISHGEAVSIGMIVESKISVANGMMKKAELERLKGLLEKIGLPTTLKANISDAIRKDKKRRGNVVKMPVLNGIGDSKIIDLRVEDLEAVVNDMC